MSQPNDPQQFQEPPHSDEAERSLLGAAMIDATVIDEIEARLDRSDLYRERHRYILESMRTLRDEKGVDLLDPVTLGEQLKRDGWLEQAGGSSYLTRLSNEVPSAANADQYLEIVAEHARLRELIATSQAIAREGHDPPSDVSEFLDRAERAIFQATQTGVRRDYRDFQAIMEDAYRHLESLEEHDGEITGLPTGFIDLDRMTGGLEAPSLTILGGRPGMGKTALAGNIIEHLAVECDVPVGAFSLEMGDRALGLRLLCSRARVNQRDVEQGQVQDWSSLVAAAGDLKEAPIVIDDTPALTVAEFRSKARRMKAEHDIQIVFIDYLQLMRAGGDHGRREQEIAEISRGLKGLSKELEIPVVALAQLNRGVEKRQDKRPQIRDLRESGQIEQDADLIAFLYRDEVYNEETEDQGIAEVLVRKQRNGPTGDIRLRFFPEHTRFESLAEGRAP